jgi:hypothetical protein
MERSLGHNARGKFAWPLIGLILLIAPAGSAIAAELQEAQVTRIVKDVRLLPTQAVPRPAAVNETVRSDTAVRTGDESRTELTFTDKTLARLGANTIFTFNEGTRNLDLGTGVMLLHVPKGAGGAKISTAAVTAAITGTTVLIEAHSGKPPVADGRSTPDGDAASVQLGLVTRKAKTADRNVGKGYVKFISLEGTARVILNGHPEESVLIHPGQMLILAPGAPHLPDLVEVDLKKLVGSCLLITDFAPLASAPLIAAEIEKQEAAYGAEGVSPVVTDPTSNDVIDQAISGVGILAAGGGGPPLGPEFGPLTTITAPVPYVVNVGTQIMTAPTITTAGVTNQGRIYRGVQADGSASAYFFGSASAFDVASGFDALGEGGGNKIPMAAFKFTSLQIAGDPTITVPPGGANNLGLVSEGGITSGAPGGTLAFAGMNSVFLGAQNGSINLGATLSFSNLNNLFLYARGAGSNVTLASPMTGMGSVEFDAEGSVQVNANETVSVFNSFTGDFLTGTGVVTAGLQISIHAQNAVNFALGQFALGAGAQVFLNGTTINMDASANPTLFTNAGGVSVTGTTGINVTGATNMTFGNLTTVDFEAGSGGIQASTMSFFHPANGLTMNAVGDINAKQILGGASISSGGNITITGNLSALQTSAIGNINVTGNLTNTQLTNATGPASTIDVGGTLTSREVEVTGDVNAAHVSVQILNQNFTTSNTILTAGAGGITPYLTFTSHLFTVSTVQSPNGINFSGNNFSTPGSNGADLILNAQAQDISAAGINGANFNGGDATPGGNPGNGGDLNIFTSGNINVTGANIDATTGIIDSAAPQPLGNGGGVVLNSSSGAISVDSRIQVSSSDPAGTANRRSSAIGGTIALTSGAVTGVAINIANTAQLLALLENTPAAQGGLITISASALTGNSQVNVGGMIEADHGGIDIRHASDAGTINLADATTLMADVVKVATLGDNSTLNIGAVNISATTLLRLYAGSISSNNNSTINFMASCNLTGAEIDIAAHTINIVGAATTVTTSSQAHVFATVANYQGFGGTGNSNTGTFTGAGAANPLPVDQAPLLGPPGGTAATALKNHAPPTGPGGR